MAELSTENPDPRSPQWCSFDWSDWISLNPENSTLAAIETDAGLYRIRHPEYDGLVYVGETGRSTRGRVRALARGSYAEEMPFRDPHTAAPTLWAMRDRDGPDLAVSWATPDWASDAQDRKGLEAALIALHRRTVGQSPTANFGRIIEGYRQSSYSSEGLVGGPLTEGETEPNAEPGVDPLDWDHATEPLHEQWMGLDWSPQAPLREAYQQIPKTPGVYRIWDHTDPQPLAYIGQSTTLRDRMYRHRRSREGGLQFSFATLPEVNATHRLEEIETELLGAHWLAYCSAPRDQF